MKERIKKIRKHFGLTQEKFAKRINKTTGFVSNVETGRGGMSDNTIRTICSAFGVNEAWLKDGVGEMFPTGVVPAAADVAGIGVRIKEIRKREKLSQEQFGERIGFTKNYVYCHPAINLRKNSANTAAHLEQLYFQRLNRSECEPVLTRVSVRMSFSIR